MERKLAAIMFTDIVGFSKIMGDDEASALSILKNQESLVSPLVENYKGNIIKKTGDGYLVEFSSSVEAVECAIAMQNSIKKYSDNNIPFEIRIGIHLGDIVILNNDILGDGVNVAARIEPLAQPGGICLTDVVYQSVKSKLDINPKRIDEVDLKHIDDKYTIYKLPNISNDKEEENMNKFDFSKDKITINSIKKITGLKYRCITVFSQFKFLIILAYLMIGIDFYLEYNLRTFLVNILITTFVFLYVAGRSRYKISFDDIRKIIPTLDNIIINDWWNGKYSRQKEDKNTMVYLGYGSHIHKKISEKFNIKHLKLKLEVKIDGNTMIIEGSGMKILSIIKNIKKVSITND